MFETFRVGMVSVEVARHTRMKNANVARCGLFDVTIWISPGAT